MTNTTKSRLAVTLAFPAAIPVFETEVWSAGCELRPLDAFGRFEVWGDADALLALVCRMLPSGYLRAAEPLV